MSPNNEERRPSPETARPSNKRTEAIFAQATDLPALIRRRTAEEEAELAEVAKFLGQCRRRREGAALRLPPMADGRRDPLGPVTDGAEP